MLLASKSNVDVIRPLTGSLMTTNDVAPSYFLIASNAIMNNLISLLVALAACGCATSSDCQRYRNMLDVIDTSRVIAEMVLEMPDSVLSNKGIAGRYSVSDSIEPRLFATVGSRFLQKRVLGYDVYDSDLDGARKIDAVREADRVIAAWASELKLLVPCGLASGFSGCEVVVYFSQIKDDLAVVQLFRRDLKPQATTLRGMQSMNRGVVVYVAFEGDRVKEWAPKAIAYD